MRITSGRAVTQAVRYIRELSDPNHFPQPVLDAIRGTRRPDLNDQVIQREAEAAGRLRHPNVVNVTDFGLTTLNGASLAYLVMEYLDGHTLAEHQQAFGRPALDLVVDIVDQVALALDTAHAAGIVHTTVARVTIPEEGKSCGPFALGGH